MALPEELRLVFEAFDRNAAVSRATLATLDTQALDDSDGVEGYNVGQRLAESVSFRREKVAAVAPTYAERFQDVIDVNAPTWLEVASIEELRAAFDAGDAAMRDAVREAVEEGRCVEAFNGSRLAHLIVHCIVHDAHHRGQILALLRQAGRSADERNRLQDETWAVWRR